MVRLAILLLLLGRDTAPGLLDPKHLNPAGR